MSPEQTPDPDSSGLPFPSSKYADRTWFWQMSHERDGWASSTKLQRVVAFLVASFVLIFSVIKGVFPAGMAELVGIYLAYAVGARYFSQSAWNKGQENVDRSRNSGQG